MIISRDNNWSRGHLVMMELQIIRSLDVISKFNRMNEWDPLSELLPSPPTNMQPHHLAGKRPLEIPFFVIRGVIKQP
jgi:hypothetical protein